MLALKMQAFTPSYDRCYRSALVFRSFVQVLLDLSCCIMFQQMNDITALVDDIKATLDPAIAEINAALASMTAGQTALDQHLTEFTGYIREVTDARVCFLACTNSDTSLRSHCRCLQ